MSEVVHAGDSSQPAAEHRIKGSSAVNMLSFLGSLVGALGVLGAILVFALYGYVGLDNTRPMFNPLGIAYALGLLVSSLCWWALAKAIAAGVENSLWIRAKLSERRE